jgi:hypothetical protein
VVGENRVRARRLDLRGRRMLGRHPLSSLGRFRRLANMMKRIAYVLVAVLIVAAAGVVVYRTYRGGAGEPGVAGEPLAAGRGPARILLNEILFAPPEGQPQWVELVNVGGDAVALDGFALENHAQERFALPSSVTMPAGSVLLVRFDGQQQIDGTTVHANRTGFLDRRSGSVTLNGPEGPQDLALWSDTGGPSFQLGRGGRIPALADGTTLGRPPESVRPGRDAWTIFFPDEATPAARNNFPAVTGMMPLSGAVLRGRALTLSWYGVSTATRYRVQVATDRSFASPVVDWTGPTSGAGIATQQMPLPALSAGRYLWRVQAIFADTADNSSAFSAPALFWLQETAVAAVSAPASSWTSVLVPTVFAAEPPSAPTGKLLPVPLILQKKDTYLLAVTATGQEETGDRPWDRPWEPAPKGPFCARASVAMVTTFFGGRLSQDRISYEAGKDAEPGPIMDIHTDDGLYDDAIERVLTFALGAPPVLRNRTASVEAASVYFDAHKAAIDNGSPVVATTRTHAFVVVGWGENERGKYLVVNDPSGGQYDWLLLPNPEFAGVDADIVGSSTQSRDMSFFMPPGARGRSEEPSIHVDTDGDGVRDFDETERFKTNPMAADTDGDGVNDKQEIRAWMFDERYGASMTGYSHSFQHADRDRDNKRMEVDADSDNGGCLDGMEDTNSNGKHEPGLREFYNFDKDDDACLSGTYLRVHDTTSFHGSQQKVDVRLAIQFSLREVDGAHKGRAIVTHSFRMVQTGLFAECGTSIVQSSEPYQYVVDIEATVATMPDGTVPVIIKSPEDWKPPIVRIVANCAAVGSNEVDGPTIGITGVLSNGVLDSRVNLPLDGYTGVIYMETHIRQSRQR